MPQGVPVNPETRSRAVQLMQVENWGRNRIARELGISGGLVSRIAADVGHVFDWKQTEIATRSAQIENAEARELLAKIALQRAFDAADAMDAPETLTVYEHGTEHTDGGWKQIVVDQPSASDQRNYATIFGIMVSKAAELTKQSSAAGDAGTISFVEGLAQQLKDAAQLARGDVDTDPTLEPTNVSKESLLSEYADADISDDPES